MTTVITMVANTRPTSHLQRLRRWTTRSEGGGGVVVPFVTAVKAATHGGSGSGVRKAFAEWGRVWPFLPRGLCGPSPVHAPIAPSLRQQSHYSQLREILDERTSTIKKAITTQVGVHGL